MSTWACHSGLMLADRITLPHLSTSLARSLLYSSGAITSETPPSSASRSLNLRSARVALIALLSLAMMSVGVSFGAPTPESQLASKPGSSSPKVGTSGSPSARAAVVTARGAKLARLDEFDARGHRAEVNLDLPAHKACE